MIVWIIVSIGVTITFIGDLLVLNSSKSGNLYLLGLAAFLFALSSVPWYILVRYYTGWIQGSILWGLMGVICSLFLAFISNEKQTAIQWFGLIVMLLGIVIRFIKI